MIQQLCHNLDLPILRLDGSTARKDRASAVAAFNLPSLETQIFLLSSKAGGLGLNLTGATRLVLFDSDWNPANDIQALSRIWREGQTRHCHIFRLVSTGTIYEKILQRQVKKTGLSALVDYNEDFDLTRFTDEDLKDIFTLDENTNCNTHDLLACSCAGTGVLPQEEVDEEDVVDDEKTGEEAVDEQTTTGNVDKTALLSELSRWRHFSRESTVFAIFQRDSGLMDASLQSVSFVMQLSANY